MRLKIMHAVPSPPFPTRPNDIRRRNVTSEEGKSVWDRPASEQVPHRLTFNEEARSPSNPINTSHPPAGHIQRRGYACRRTPKVWANVFSSESVMTRKVEVWRFRQDLIGGATDTPHQKWSSARDSGTRRALGQEPGFFYGPASVHTTGSSIQ